jgi:hypothetical protein
VSTYLSPTIDLECGVCHTRFETDLLEASEARRLACPTCKTSGETPGDLALLEAFARVPELLSSAHTTFTFNALNLTEKPRLPGPAPRSTDDEETTIGWAEARYQTALEACRAGRWQEAFKAALDAQEQVEAAARMIASATCPKCKKRIASPGSWSKLHKARFWRGQCPRCETVLRVTAP